MTATDAATVGRLIQLAEAGSREVARQRSRLHSVWAAANQEVERVQAQIRAVDFTLGRREAASDELMKKFGVLPADASRYAVPPVATDGWLQPNGNGNWTVKPEIERQFDTDYANARQKFIDARARTFGGGLKRFGEEALGRYEAWLSRLGEVRSALDAELARVTAARSRSAAEERYKADSALAPAEALARQTVERLPAPLQPWSSPIWRDWSAEPTVPGLDCVYAGSLTPVDDGDLGDNAAFGSIVEIPYAPELPPSLSDADLTGASALMDRWDRSLGNNDAVWACLETIARSGGFRGAEAALREVMDGKPAEDVTSRPWRWWAEASRVANARGDHVLALATRARSRRSGRPDTHRERTHAQGARTRRFVFGRR